MGNKAENGIMQTVGEFPIEIFNLFAQKSGVNAALAESRC